MKQALKRIYQDLALGLLSQREAFEKIKSLKQSSASDAKFPMQVGTKPVIPDAQQSAVHFILPSWEQNEISSFAHLKSISEKVLLHVGFNDCTFEEHAALSDYSIQQLAQPAKANGTELGDDYLSAASDLFEKIQAIFKRKLETPCFVQLLISHRLDSELFLGLSSLLKTATLENPLMTFQVLKMEKELLADEVSTRVLNNARFENNSIIRYENQNGQVVRETLVWRTSHQLGKSGLAISDNSPLTTEKAIKTEQDVRKEQNVKREIFHNSGVYVITGGRGGIGKVIAREILEQSSHATIVLSGRSELSQHDIIELKKEVSNNNLTYFERLEYRSVDVAELNQVKQLFESIASTLGPITGIFHCAGINRDNFLLKQTLSEFNNVLKPKVTGTVNLDKVTRNMALDFFVNFSSIAAALGNVGQSDYACANGFMDYFSSYRNALVKTGDRKGLTLSLNWPLWTEGGMTIDEQSLRVIQQETGIHSINPRSALDALYHCFELAQSNANVSQVVIAPGEQQKIEQSFSLESSKLFRDRSGSSRIEANAPSNEIHSAVKVDTADSLSVKAMDAQAINKVAIEFLRKELSELLKLPLHKVDTEASFEKFGIDSILAMDLTRQLEKTFGRLSKTLFFEYQTVKELADYFANNHSEKLGSQTRSVSTKSHSHVAKPITSVDGLKKSPMGSLASPSRFISPTKIAHRSDSRPVTHAMSVEDSAIAIIGLSGRYPESTNIQEYWENLANGKDCIVEIPEERWKWADYFSDDRTEKGKHFSKWGGFIDGVDEFDPRFFNISPREAKSIDPQERLFLQYAWMAVEDAGYTREKLQLKRDGSLSGQVGVYAGVMYGEYNLSGSLASIANRVSYVLNLHGPSITLDTMCSSSLTAMHLACQDLKQKTTDLAIAGGVNVSIDPNKYLMLSEGQFISSDGHCQSFGEGGDGYIPGEGVGVVILKRLLEAENDGDQIYGVIRGSALNHGGKTNGYTVPNPQAQASAISQALINAKIDPREISYIEAHGTGTKLGDPIEIAALNKSFNDSIKSELSRSSETLQAGFCRIGSAKSNIGHCESAAGIAGVTKVLMQMKHQQIAPSLHSTILNPHIDFENSPFVVNQSLMQWEQPVFKGKQIPRIAGVSSFGAGGSNAHILLEEYTSQRSDNRKVIQNESLVILSARTVEQLKQKTKDLLGFLNGAPANQTGLLEDLCYTLQIGREAMECRFAILVDTLDSLKNKLAQAVSEGFYSNDLFFGQVSDHLESINIISDDEDMAEAVDKWFRQRKLAKIADIWVKGLSIQWSKLYVNTDKSTQPLTLGLPTYPFAKEKYWKDKASVVHSSEKETLSHRLHPLLHKNTSSFSQQSYSSLFSGDESFVQAITFSDNTVRKHVPMIHALEMVELAVAHGLGLTENEKDFSFFDVNCSSPIWVDGIHDLSIALMINTPSIVDFELFVKRDAEIQVLCQGHCHLDSVEPVNSEQWIDRSTLKSRSDIAQQFLDSSEFAAIQFGNASQLESSSQVASNSTIQPLDKNTRENSVDLNLKHDQVVEASVIVSKSLQQNRLSAISSKKSTFADVIKKGSSEPPFLSIPELTVQRKPEKIKLEKADSILLDNTLNNNAISHVRPSKWIHLLAMNHERLEESREFKHSTLLNGEVDYQQPQAMVTLTDFQNGVFVVEINDHAKNTITLALLEQLERAFISIEMTQEPRVVIVRGNESHFLTGIIEPSLKGKLELFLLQLATFKTPIISEVQGHATGLGILIASLGDILILNTQSEYRYVDDKKGSFPSFSERAYFVERFGALISEHLLFGEKALSGREMIRLGFSGYVLTQNEIGDTSESIALSLANMSTKSLELLKPHLSKRLVPLIKSVNCDLFGQEQLSAQENELSKEKIDELNLSSSLTPPSKRLSIELSSNSNLYVTVRRLKKKYSLKLLTQDLLTLFRQLNHHDGIKSVFIRSELDDFLPDLTQSYVCDPFEELQQLIMSSSQQINVAYDHNANGVAWLLGLSCDTVVYNNEGTFRLNDLKNNVSLYARLTHLLSMKYGARALRMLGLVLESITGSELVGYVGQEYVVSKDEISNTIERLSSRTIQWSKIESGSLKQQFESDYSHAMASMSFEKTSVSLQLKGTNDCELQSKLADEVNLVITNQSNDLIQLSTGTVSAELNSQGIMIITMKDQDARNMFSDSIISGLNALFDYVEQSDRCKVVILTGYDNYFASGGTKEGLLAIQEGKVQFTDVNTYQLPLNCKVPVISAMQGHAIGAGWSMGMFADIIIFSEESRYVSPYMNYGFTPGAGSTAIFSNKVGYDLARESLLTANEFSGVELKERLSTIDVYPRKMVLDKAIFIAEKIAKNSQKSNMLYKWLTTHKLQSEIDSTYRDELAMHQQTFVGQSDTLNHIQLKFKDEQVINDAEYSFQTESNKTVETVKSEGRSPAGYRKHESNVSLDSVNTHTVGAVHEKIKGLLAEELHLDVAEIGDNTQFIDLGLDSITGVTWVRNINKAFELSLEATIVYSYPTLKQFGRFIFESLEQQQTGSVSENANSESMIRDNDKLEQLTTSSNTHNLSFMLTPELDNEKVEHNAVQWQLVDVLARLKHLLASELHLSEDEIDNKKQFVDLGLDSITGVTWVRNINQTFSLSLEATIVYSYPTLAEFGQFIFNQSSQTSGHNNSQEERTSVDSQLSTHHKESNEKPFEYPSSLIFKPLVSWQNQHSTLTKGHRSSINPKAQSSKTIMQDIAVIGMAGQFPQANNLEEYWDNIAQAKNCISQVPKSRWDVDAYYQEGMPAFGKSNSQWMGALEEFDCFDPLFFTISPTEAESMDPQQRLFLQSCWHGIENAGYSPEMLSGSLCGVFVGCAAGDYNLQSRSQQISAQGFTGGATSVLAARISYVLNLQGPCLSIDTACSSSLVAIANACDSLNLGSSDLALAGGVYVLVGPDMHIKTSQSGMLSQDGQCFTFDQRANGFVPGEGVGVVLLKRLADAERDRDIIHGVIRGWGVNQDGKTNGITAPNPESQTRLQQKVYDSFNIDPESIQLIEAHGTGTKLGDPIEVEALKTTFSRYTNKTNYCALGSVKSNIGHCLTAAGISGVIKLLLSIKHQQLPPTVNFEKLNEHVGLDKSPFFVNDKLQDWTVQEGGRRQAAISSFGFSGTNAHLVIGEHQSTLKVSHRIEVVTEQSKMIVPLSAKTDDAIKRQAKQLIHRLENRPSSINTLESIAYTLQVGREAMEYRAALLVASVDELIQKLNAFIHDDKSLPGMFSAKVKDNKEGLKLIAQDDEMRETIVNQWISQNKLSKLADLWVKGLELDWNKLYGAVKPQKCELPVYPFAKERYWVDLDDVQFESTVQGANHKTLQTAQVDSSKIHPLLHSQTTKLALPSEHVNNGSKFDSQSNKPKSLQRICLPTYPFAKLRCWVDDEPSSNVSVTNAPIERSHSGPTHQLDFTSIEDILNKIGDDSIETTDAVNLLKSLA